MTMRPVPAILAACERIEFITFPRVSPLEARTLSRDTRELLDALRAAEQERDEARAEAEALRRGIEAELSHAEDGSVFTLQILLDRVDAGGSLALLDELRTARAAFAAAEHDRDEALTDAQAAHVERDRLRGALEDGAAALERMIWIEDRHVASGVTWTTAPYEVTCGTLYHDARQALVAMNAAIAPTPAQKSALLATLSAVRTEGAPPHGDDAEGEART